MKKNFLFLILGAMSLAACGGGGSGGSGNSNPMRAAIQQNKSGFIANDPSTPRIPLDQAIVGKWSTDCVKTNMPQVPYTGLITDIRENGSIYSARGYFVDSSCTVGAESGIRTKLGSYELLDMADLQPSGDIHIKSRKSFNQTAQGEFRESMIHIALSGRNAETMQLTTTDQLVRNGNATVENTQSYGRTKIAHRVRGI